MEGYNTNKGSSDRLKIKYPVTDHGIITNWDDIEKIWHHIYKSLGVNPKRQRVLISEPPVNPNANRENTIQVFEND